MNFDEQLRQSCPLSLQDEGVILHLEREYQDVSW